MSDIESALKSVLSSQAAEVAPPTEVYAAVRRRHARRQRTILAGTVVVLLTVVAVPVLLLDRSSPPPALKTAGCAVSGEAVPATDVPGLPVTQTGVRGSLGGDQELVRAAARVGYVTEATGHGGAHFVAATTRVELLERVDGQVVGLVTVRDADRKNLGLAYVVGPDAAGLRGVGQGDTIAGTPITTPFPKGSSDIGAVLVCGRPYGVVVAPPGTAVRASWVTDIAASGEGVVTDTTVPLGADGSAVFPLTAANVHVRVPGNDALLSTGGELFGPPPDAVARAVAAAPTSGDPDPTTVGAIVAGQPDVVPVPQSGLRVLWACESGGLTVAIAATRLPSGAYYVWAGSAVGTDGSPDGWSGILPAGGLDRALLAWSLSQRPGRPVVVWSARGGSQVTFTPGGATDLLLRGGAIRSPGEGIRRVTVPGVGDQSVSGGLLPMPRY